MAVSMITPLAGLPGKLGFCLCEMELTLMPIQLDCFVVILPFVTHHLIIIILIV